jgi:integrase
MPKTANRKSINERLLHSLKAKPRKYLVWDERLRGLAVEVQPTGRKAWKFVYSLRGRGRWYTIGPVDGIGIDEARTRAKKLIGMLADDRDPMAERMVERNADTFQKLAVRFLNEHAKKRNKSWKQADYLIRAFVLPKWGSRKAGAITRADVKELRGGLKPSVGNQTMAAISAIYSWGMKEEAVASNPCKGVERNPTRSRERVLSEQELPAFWNAFAALDSTTGRALQTLLLLGQRPGEISAMRREHIDGGWWTLPGAAQPELGWLGTKNHATHRIWLPHVVQKLIGKGETGFVFANAARDLSDSMRDICAKLKAERCTPHDLRRTHGTMVTSLGFGRDIMNRIQNHKEGGIGDVYDRHSYGDEIRRTMEAVANKVMALVDGRADDGTVVQAEFRR